jgi:hypothetical protein
MLWLPKLSYTSAPVTKPEPSIVTVTVPAGMGFGVTDARTGAADVPLPPELAVTGTVIELLQDVPGFFTQNVLLAAAPW